MLLDLSKIRTPHERFEQVYPPDAFAGFADADEATVVAPVSLAFELFKDGSHARLAGTTKTTVEMPCSRCLEPLTVMVEAAFDLRYQPLSADAASGTPEREIEEDDFATAYYENEQIDLGQLMREQLLLALPMKPLCNTSCHGLCPVCGTNLNREPCDCKRGWDDPRLAALKKLRSEN